MVRLAARILGALCMVTIAGGGGALAVTRTASAQNKSLESPLVPIDSKLESLPFQGSRFGFGQNLTANTLARGEQLSYNPTYSMNFSLFLNWQIDEKTSLALDQLLLIELTQNDAANGQKRALLNDTRLGFRRTLFSQKINSELAWGLDGTADLLAPTSLSSQAATVILGTRVGASGGLSFPKVLSGAGVYLSGTYLHRFMRSNVVEVDEGFPCFAGGAASDQCTQLGGSTNTRNSFRLGLSAQLALTDKWGISLTAFHTWARAADLADAEFRTDTGGIERLRAGDAKHWRNSNFLDVGASYSLVSWLGLGFGVTNSFSELAPNGNLRAPLNSNDMYLHLDLDFRLDEIYLITSGRR